MTFQTFGCWESSTSRGRVGRFGRRSASGAVRRLPKNPALRAAHWPETRSKAAEVLWSLPEALNPKIAPKMACPCLRRLLILGMSDGELEVVPLLTEKEVARQLAITPRRMRDLRYAGDLPGVLVGRLIRYKQSDVDAFVERNRLDGPRPPAVRIPTMRKRPVKR